MSTAGAARAPAIRAVVCAVTAAAVRAAHAGGVVLMEDSTPEGELVHGWLVDELGTDRVWRVTSLASNVHGAEPAEAQIVAVRRAEREQQALVAHPATKTALLLGGPIPRADLFPLGDLYASQVAQLATGCTLPPAVMSLAERSGGVRRLDAALIRLIEGRESLSAATEGLEPDTAEELTELYERGRFYRLRPRLIPKLSARTLGVDLFD